MRELKPGWSGAWIRGDEILLPENVLQGILVVGGEAEVEMSSPSLSLVEDDGNPADVEGEFFE